MGGAVKAVLVKLGVVFQVFGLIEESRFSGNKQEGGVFFHAFPGTVDLEGCQIVVARVVVVAHAQAGEFEQVDAAAVSFGDIRCNVDAGNLVHPFVIVLVHAVFFREAVLETVFGIQLEECVNVLLGVGLGEGETEFAVSVIYGSAAGDGLAAVGNLLRAAGTGSHGKGSGEAGDADVLEDAGLRVIVAGDGVSGKTDGKAHRRGIGAQVNGVQGGDEREGGLTGGESEHFVADGADGELGRGITRQGVGVFHLDFGEVELHRMGVVEQALVHQPFSQAVVHFHAARKDQGCSHAQGKDFSHFNKSS